MTLRKHIIVPFLVAALFGVGMMYQVGRVRAGDDYYWCGPSLKPTAECVAERRSERWGPFKALGSNHHTD